MGTQHPCVPHVYLVGLHRYSHNIPVYLMFTLWVYTGIHTTSLCTSCLPCGSTQVFTQHPCVPHVYLVGLHRWAHNISVYLMFTLWVYTGIHTTSLCTSCLPCGSTQVFTQHPCVPHVYLVGLHRYSHNIPVYLMFTLWVYTGGHTTSLCTSCLPCGSTQVGTQHPCVPHVYLVGLHRYSHNIPVYLMFTLWVYTGIHTTSLCTSCLPCGSTQVGTQHPCVPHVYLVGLHRYSHNIPVYLMFTLWVYTGIHTTSLCTSCLPCGSTQVCTQTTVSTACCAHQHTNRPSNTQPAVTSTHSPCFAHKYQAQPRKPFTLCLSQTFHCTGNHLTQLDRLLQHKDPPHTTPQPSTTSETISNNSTAFYNIRNPLTQLHSLLQHQKPSQTTPQPSTT